MRLGINASEMQGERTGVGRYVEGVLTGLSRVDFDGEVHLYFQGEPFEHALFEDPRFRCTFARAGSRSGVWWEQLSLSRLLEGANLDVFLGPAYSLPPIESLAAGTPPVVSRGLGLDDLWPDYPFRCDRLESAEIERVTRRALDDEVLRREVAARGRELVRTLRWEDYARRDGGALRRRCRALVVEPRADRGGVGGGGGAGGGRGAARRRA